MKKINFNKKIMILGFGTIGSAVLPLILRHFNIKSNQIIIIDSDIRYRAIANKQSITFKQFHVTEKNYSKFLSKNLHPGDILLNLSVAVSSLDLITQCQQLGALYLDTSTEMWPRDLEIPTFMRREKLLEKKREFLMGPTALICHGANPGLVTHFSKRAILEVAKNSGIKNFPKNNNKSYRWAEIAEQCNITAIHISERDSQQGTSTCHPDEYVNTWSIDVFFDEASEDAQFSLGSHEIHFQNSLVRKQYLNHKLQAVELVRPGAVLKTRSWIPSCQLIKSFMISHPECFSLAELFATHNSKNGSFYQPTVLYAYNPCRDSLPTLLRDSFYGNLHMNMHKRLLIDSIVKGADELGVLIIRHHSSKIYWYGSILKIDEARKLAPHNNATTLQVAAGILSGLVWIIENPRQGLIEPEEVDFERALEIATPYLGHLNGFWASWDARSSETTINISIPKDQDSIRR